MQVHAMCVSLCPKQSRNMAHRRMSRELSQEGRQPRPLTFLSLANKKKEKKTHTDTHAHTRKLRDGGACRPAHVFFCHLIRSFPIRLIYTAWSLEDQGTTGFKRQHSNVLTDFSTSPLTLRFRTTHHLPVAERKQKLDVYDTTAYSHPISPRLALHISPHLLISPQILL